MASKHVRYGLGFVALLVAAGGGSYLGATPGSKILAFALPRAGAH